MHLDLYESTSNLHYPVIRNWVFLKDMLPAEDRLYDNKDDCGPKETYAVNVYKYFNHESFFFQMKACI